MPRKNGAATPAPATDALALAIPFAAFKVREWAKSEGARWDGANKVWTLPDAATLEKVRALVAQYEAGDAFDPAALARADADVTRTGGLFDDMAGKDRVLEARAERDAARADVERLSALMRERDEGAGRALATALKERNDALDEVERLRALTSPTLNEAALDALASQAADAVRRAVRSILTPTTKPAPKAPETSPKVRALDLDETPKPKTLGAILSDAGLTSPPRAPAPTRPDAQSMPHPPTVQAIPRGASPAPKAPETPAPAPRVGGLQKCLKCRRFALGTHSC